MEEVLVVILPLTDYVRLYLRGKGCVLSPTGSAEDV